MAKLSGPVKISLAILFVLLGCCSNVVFLELLVKLDPGSGSLVTFSQFVFISLEGFIFTTKFGTERLHVPIKEYAKLVAFYFFVNNTNNWVFSFNISMTLHLIFRSGSLIASMVLGMIIMGKRYTLKKYLSVILVSFGILLCTVASAQQLEDKDDNSVESGVSGYMWWLIGIFILTLSLLMSARMGLYQEEFYSKYGKHPRESLFYSHCLPLPAFALIYSDLMVHIAIANASEPMSILGISIPCIWLYIIGNVLTQCFCINSVYVLSTECPSLTVNLVVTLRKFVSLLFSIYYFNNPFSTAHWFGAVCVFLGTILYSDLNQIFSLSTDKKLKKSD